MRKHKWDDSLVNNLEERIFMCCYDVVYLYLASYIDILVQLVPKLDNAQTTNTNHKCTSFALINRCETETIHLHSEKDR